MKHRKGDALKHLEHPVTIRRELTPRHLEAGNIANKQEVIIDSRTRIYIAKDADPIEAADKWRESHKASMTPFELDTANKLY